MSSSKRVTLIFPPYMYVVNTPYLAPAWLASHLRGRGIDARYIDLNIHFAHFLARLGGELEQVVTGRLDTFKSYEEKGRLEPMERYDAAEILAEMSWMPPRLLSERLAGSFATARPLRPELEDELLGDLYSRYLCYFRPPSAIPLYFDDLQAEVELSAEDDPVPQFFATTPLVDEIAESSSLVGISVVYTEQARPALALAKLLKEKNADLRIVLGGANLALFSAEEREQLAKLPYIDGLVLYDGEKALEGLVAVVNDGESLSQGDRKVVRFQH